MCVGRLVLSHRRRIEVVPDVVRDRDVAGNLRRVGGGGREEGEPYDGDSNANEDKNEALLSEQVLNRVGADERRDGVSGV